MERIIEIKNLKKTFKGVDVVNIEEMNVYKQDIYGFLGPNGAGKTTTMKMLLGILGKTSGTLKFNEDKSIKIGSMIEEPAFYENLTGKENLEIMRKLLKFPKKNIDETLKLVGLHNARNKLSKHYSLGMKQRLGIALSLVNEPDVLILDEPTNGLDPEGIIEIRKLLKYLNEAKGVTILISSHQLSEISNLATKIGIIRKGQIIFEGSKKDISNMSRTKIRISTHNKEKVMNLLEELNYKYQLDGNSIYTGKLNDEESYNLLRMFITENIEVYELSPEIKTLESIYIELISKGGEI
ncbi:MAG: ABC transporter ATP-binding protein [Treponema sp.]